jgi:hypothetical protein
MATYQGSFGKVSHFEDFVGIDPDATWAAGGFDIGGVSITSVNEGSVESTVDEPGGVVAITIDSADNDNVALYYAPVKPSDGGAVMEARLKGDNLSDLSFYVGYTETLAKDTPVMPAEFATATMTYNGTGGMVGLQFDSDGTTDGWRALCGDGGAATAGSGNGTLATSIVGEGYATTADRWDIVRVELDSNATARVFLNGKLIDTFVGGLDADNLFFPVVMAENRAGSAGVLEVDYFYTESYRSWATD